MLRDPWFMFGVGCGVVGFTAAAWLLVDPPGTVRRIRVARRKAADRGYVNLR